MPDYHELHLDHAMVRGVRRDADQLLKRAVPADIVLRRSWEDVLRWYARLFTELVDAQLHDLPLESLRSSTDGRLSLAPLADVGYSRVGQLQKLSEADLVRLPGLGVATARAILGALAGMRATVVEETRFRIDFDPSNQSATGLLNALDTYDLVRGEAGGVREDLGHWIAGMRTDLAASASAGLRVRWWFTSDVRKQQATDAIARLRQFLNYASVNRLAERLDRIVQAGNAPLTDPWPRFESRAADYYALLSELVAVPTPVEAEQGFLTEEVVASVEAQPLDSALRRVDLRGYQSFGARFALARRRVIIGDEMGLGKTIQALAAITHLRASQPGLVLVVCPATVMPNWEREVVTRTVLPAITLHGEDKQDDVSTWLSTGAVAITTYETLRRLELPSNLHLLALVVDEAHYVKNPETRRSREVRKLTALSDHVWFLTGTPMENSVDEFAELIRFLQSDLVPPDGARLGSVAFRRKVSPVYLRRNAADVLAELPEKQEVDEWVRFTRSDRERYQAAVQAGNLMAIRRAGFGAGDCAKAARLAELLVEAAANHLKAVVYSFFLEVIELARTVAPVEVFGPITGAVPPAQRQAIIDAFTAHCGPAVLLAQIQAGGVGLNIQAASVVVLCEPQLTPTSEEQAVARSHRMGQVRPVQVHRILAEDSVDEQIVTLLDNKRAEFDDYARRSELSEATVAAVDLSLPSLSRQLVFAEQARELR